MLAGFAFQFATYVVPGARLASRTAHGPACRSRCGGSLPIALCKLFVDQVVPAAGMGGNVLLVDRLRALGAPRGTAMSTLLVSILGYYAAYAVLALAMMVALWLDHAATALVVGPVTAFLLVTLAIPSLYLWTWKRGARPLPRSLERFPPLARLFAIVSEAPPELVGDRPLIARVALWNGLIVLADAATLAVCLHALGGPLLPVDGVHCRDGRVDRRHPGAASSGARQLRGDVHGDAGNARCAGGGRAGGHPAAADADVVAAVAAGSVAHAARGPSGEEAAVTAQWAMDGKAALASLDSGTEGLSAAQASARLAKYGPNRIGEGEERSWPALLRRQFLSPLALILIFGAAISMGLGEWLDASIILAILAGSGLLSFAQEYRANKAVAALRAQLALRVKVRRKGRRGGCPGGFRSCPATSFCSPPATSCRPTAWCWRRAIAR